jgi:DNA-binding XRE family transcriptional regulator
MPNVKIRLAAVRANAHKTQEEWAKELGVDKQTVCNWENGKGEPKMSHLQRMSELSGIPMDCIFF